MIIVIIIMIIINSPEPRPRGAPRRWRSLGCGRNGVDTNCSHFSICACHPWAGAHANLHLSDFDGWSPKGIQNGVDTHGAAAKVTNLKDWGNAYWYATLSDFDRFRQIGTQKVPLSKNMKFAVTPLVLTPFEVYVHVCTYVCIYIYIERER